jgi:hypothetical protein
MLINHYIDTSKTKKIILCCEPILGTRENSISYRNFMLTPDERYANLIGYYKALGLKIHANVFMILNLYMKLYGHDAYSTEEARTEARTANLAKRRKMNSQEIQQKYYETRMFMLGVFNDKFTAEKIKAIKSCTFTIDDKK